MIVGYLSLTFVSLILLYYLKTDYIFKCKLFDPSSQIIVFFVDMNWMCKDHFTIIIFMFVVIFSFQIIT